VDIKYNIVILKLNLLGPLQRLSLVWMKYLKIHRLKTEIFR